MTSNILVASVLQSHSSSTLMSASFSKVSTTSPKTSTVYPSHASTSFVTTQDSSTGHRKQSPALYISLIVLSTLIIISTLVASWIFWRRYKRKWDTQPESDKANSKGPPAGRGEEARPLQHVELRLREENARRRSAPTRAETNDPFVHALLSERLGRNVSRSDRPKNPIHSSRDLPAAPCSTRDSSPASSSRGNGRRPDIDTRKIGPLTPMTPSLFTMMSPPLVLTEEQHRILSCPVSRICLGNCCKDETI
jgi:hypothetical protein